MHNYSGHTNDKQNQIGENRRLQRDRVDRSDPLHFHCSYFTPAAGVHYCRFFLFGTLMCRNGNWRATESTRLRDLSPPSKNKVPSVGLRSEGVVLECLPATAYRRCDSRLSHRVLCLSPSTEGIAFISVIARSLLAVAVRPRPACGREPLLVQSSEFSH